MNIQSRLVTRPSQIVVGEFYFAAGTNFRNESIPPQIMHITDKPLKRGALELPYIVYNVAVNVGVLSGEPVILRLQGQQAYLYEFNVFDTTDHSIIKEVAAPIADHDIHLQHIPGTDPAAVMEALRGMTEYTDIARNNGRGKP